MGNIPGKPITDLIGELEGGSFLIDATQAVYDVMAAVAETRKVGGLTITLAFAPTGRGTVEVAAKIKTTIPEEPRPATAFFVGKDNSLQRRDPNQPSLDLRVAHDASDGLPRDVFDPKTGELKSAG